MTKFLLISDIHACDEDPSNSDAPSYVSSVSPTSLGEPDPIGSLEKLLKGKPELRPDFILCAGDITNKAHPGSLTYAWSKLDILAQSVGAKLVATVGNHDIDSRYKENKFDPRGYVMSLKPEIPAPNRNSFLEYWAENFTILSHPDLNLAVINTAAYHGGGKESAVEIEHGRISELTLAGIAKRLKSLPKASVNILLCHHHPSKGDAGDKDIGGPTRGGERLIDLLGQDKSAWVVVHGHKHVPDLFYGQGGSNSPVILACASFAAQVNADAQNKNPNQVHLLQCDPAHAKSAGLVSAGTVLTWTWQPGLGWSPAKAGQGLPHKTGFGFRGSPATLVKDLEIHLSKSGVAHMQWAEALKLIPSVQNLIPSDFDLFARHLEDAGMHMLHERSGEVAQIGIVP